MDTTAVIANRSDVTTVTSAPRPTPTPVRVQFSEVLAKSMIAGAERVMRALPGAPTMAVALRGGGGVQVGVAPMSSPLGATLANPSVSPAPEGPGAGGTALGGATDGAGIEQSLAQSQEMNLYYLQIQEQVNAENRSFSTLSNVLKAEHDTVKTAIGNIR